MNQAKVRFKESEKGTENTIERVDALCNKNLVWNLNSAPFEKWFFCFSIWTM